MHSTLEQAETESATEQTQETENQHSSQTCPECNGALTSEADPGERSCTDCGLVVEEDRIDHGPEWRNFDDSEYRSRVGSPRTELLHDKGLSTEIDWRNRDSYGNSLSSSQRKKMNRLRKWNTRFQTEDNMDRNLRQALAEIQRMASALGVPRDVQEMASVIYQRALEEDLIRGRSIESVATAALYGASRQAGTPRPIDKFAAVSRVGKMDFKRAYRYINRELGLQIEPTRPEEYIPQMLSELEDRGVFVGMKGPNPVTKVEQEARSLLAEAEMAKISGKNPVGLAAAAIYAGARLVGGAQISQVMVAEVADVSEVTIRNRYPDLLESRDIPI